MLHHDVGALAELEESILHSASGPAPALFVLGSPRTGSTFLYQVLVSAFSLPFIDNLTNQFFPRTPILGLLMGASIPEAIGFSSRYGKTTGLRQPSEGSAVVAHWFGGGHPSQLVSNRVRDGMESHLVATLRATNALLGGPLTIKNAWNCFRTDYLAAALPAANFVWVRRDIAAAAKSDLQARYATQGRADTWNSATPANVEALRGRPVWEQVVENQFEFGKAIAATRDCLPRDRFVEIWYEDCVADLESTVQTIGAQLGLLRHRAPAIPKETAADEPAAPALRTEEAEALDAYVRANAAKLHAYIRG
jgi:hypothetical protein